MDLAFSLRPRVASLAAEGVFVGTSSWKYEGWAGQIYTPERYETRKKWSQAKFERECLKEYAETFSTVCVDAGYYQFPTEAYLAGLCGQVPEGFRFGFKVTDEVTLKKFPNLPRFGQRAGTTNPHFLDAGLFYERFITPCLPFRSKIGPLIFEFSTFHKHDFEHGRDFVAALDGFLGALPSGWEYGVEIRNKAWLQPEYFACLRSHGVAHTFNSWSRMPAIEEQLALNGSETAGHSVARFLLRPGQTYEGAVKAFQPYTRIQDPNEGARGAARRLLEGSLQKKRHCYVYVDNRLEGCAPLTIAAILELGTIPPPPSDFTLG